MGRLRGWLVLIGVALALVPALLFAQSSATVSGTITLRPTESLPVNAVVIIQIADVSASGRPGSVIAQQSFGTGGAQAPFRFTLNYDPARIQAGRNYTIQGSINLNGTTRYSTDTLIPLPPNGGSVGVSMVRVGLPGTAAGTAPLAVIAALLVALLVVRATRRWMAYDL